MMCALIEERAALLKAIEGDRDTYAFAAWIEEWAYWIGATIAAICSALAGLSVAAGLGDGSWKLTVAALAVVPAVWAAIDRTLKLRQLSAHNYRFAAANEALLVQARVQFCDAETQQIARNYTDIIRIENTAITALLLPDDKGSGVVETEPPMGATDAGSKRSETRAQP
jgi:signal transduction histidine kinase